MSDMPSSEFRKKYPKLKEFTTVTVNGHPIGTWIPATTHFAPPELERDLISDLHHGDRLSAQETSRHIRQAQRDDLLHKINRGK